MLEKIMDLHILLYSMAAIGAVGAIGMLATNLTYRRLLKSTGSRKAGSKNGSAWYPKTLSMSLWEQKKKHRQTAQSCPLQLRSLSLMYQGNHCTPPANVYGI